MRKNMQIQSNIIKSLFQNVYFITGTAYAGKSTAVKLLAERFDGICCGENYHDVFMKHIDKEFQPNLAYFDTMKDWQEFISRTPDEYAAWIDGCSKEAESLEIIRLLQLVADIGGTPTNSVTSKTDILVVGQQDFRIVGSDGMSSKQKKALQLLEKGQNIEVLSESDFLQLK